jgi:hypothetical protein
MTKITAPGVYDLSDAEYQGEPAATPSLRSSIAWKLIARGSCPAMARWEHPALNPDFEPENKRAFDIGRAVHKIILGKGAQIVEIDAKDYRKDDAKEAREAAWKAGQIPLLPNEHKQVKAMAKAARDQMATLVKAGVIETMPFEHGETEKTIVWRDGNTLCRAMLDGLPHDNSAIDEVKTTGASADVRLWEWRQARELGYMFRQSFYRRGLETLKLAYSPHFRFFVIENFPPYLMSFIRVDDRLIAREDKRVRHALEIWDRCMQSGEWPGYPIGEIGLSDKEKAQELGLLKPELIAPSAHQDSSDVPESAYETVGEMIAKKRKA